MEAVLTLAERGVRECQLKLAEQERLFREALLAHRKRDAHLLSTISALSAALQVKESYLQQFRGRLSLLEERLERLERPPVNSKEEQ